MKKMLVFSALLLSVIGCGGGGGGDSEDVGSGASAVESSTSQTSNFAGTWAVETKKSSDNCNLLQDSDINEISGNFFIGQSATDVVIFLGGAKCSEPFSGLANGDSFLVSRVSDVTSCSDGSDAALVEHVAFDGLAGDETRGVTISFEIGCPNKYCRYDFTGTARRTSAVSGQCFSQGGCSGVQCFRHADASPHVRADSRSKFMRQMQPPRLLLPSRGH